MARFPRYAPEFQIRINGEPLPPAMRASVSSVSYQDGLEGADRVEMVLANENLQWLDHPLFQPDAEFTLSMGYAPDPLTEMFVGEITGVTASFPNSGMPTLTVVAHDFLQRLTNGRKDRAFALSLPCIGRFPLPDPLIAQLVSATNLLVPAVDPAGAALSFLTLLVAYAIDPLEAKNSIRVQQGESDFDFLAGLARENGWEMYIDHTAEPRGYILRFQFLIQDYAPIATFKWGESLMDFSPRLSTVGQVASVAVRLYISSIKLELVLVLGWDYDRAAFDLQIYPGLGSLDDLVGSGSRQGLLKISASGPLTAPKQILGELLPRLNNRLTCSASVIGDTQLRAARVVNFEGVGQEFSGLYRITSAVHTIDSSGYRTQFEGRKEVWFGSTPIPTGASGLVRAQGQTIG